jgi:hypothetical protein
MDGLSTLSLSLIDLLGPGLWTLKVDHAEMYDSSRLLAVLYVEKANQPTSEKGRREPFPFVGRWISSFYQMECD